MIGKIAVRWAEFMVANGAPEDQEEVYAYAMECSLNELASDLLLIIMAAFLGRIWEMVVWIVLFNILRLNVGGYHASTPLRCILMSTALGVACTLVYPFFMEKKLLVSAITVLCTAAVFMVAPVLNQNHPLSQKRQESAKRKARRLAVAVAVLTGGLLLTGEEKLSSMAAVSYCSVLLLSILAKAMQQAKAGKPGKEG